MNTTLVGRGFDQYFEQSDFTLGKISDSSHPPHPQMQQKTPDYMSFSSSNAIEENDKLLPAFLMQLRQPPLLADSFFFIFFKKAVILSQKHIYDHLQIWSCLPHLAAKTAVGFHNDCEYTYSIIGDTIHKALLKDQSIKCHSKSMDVSGNA